MEMSTLLSIAAPKTANRTAVLIACKNGEATIANAVSSAAVQADVYVVSDGSDDRTAERAREAGAFVLARETSGGKPAALRAGASEFSLAEKYDYIAVLDDDTALEPSYIERTTRGMDADAKIAATSGRIDSLWNHQRRWNIPIAMRAFMYWSYQVTIKRGQNALRVVNVICGANTVFRSSVFKELIEEDAPYAIDDMYWLAEIMRRRLGRIAYVHTARSWTIDPHRFRDWYKQTVRWSWGQFQSIRGHRLGWPIRRARGSRFGFRFSWFDTAYFGVLLDWVPYMLEPLALPILAYFFRGWLDPLWFLVFFLAGSFLWICVAAIALRKPRLVVLAPALIVLDLIYRVAMMHALVKAILVPKIEVCRWDSPERFELDGQVRN
jgi:cellulose synthase/poly-beta-1,6-N-acetylglucosamine synthase-like glycosyltransferase